MDAIDRSTQQRTISDRMKLHYERVWSEGDAWSFESSAYEQRRYDRHLSLLEGRRYGKALEIGCGSGQLTRRLATVSDRLLAVDISAVAVDRARATVAPLEASTSIELRAADVMQLDLAAEGPWDLVVFSETIYCLGWLYPMFDVAFLAANLHAAMRPGGRLLLSNTYGAERDWLLRPYLIDTYRDLFRNVGFTPEREDVFEGPKEGVEMRVLMSLFARTESGRT
jgi:SAM-dependent methyltransferase